MISLRSLILLGCVGLSLLSGCDRLQSVIYRRAAEKLAAGDREDWLTDGALHLVLCGTGTPLADPERAGPCAAVIANKKFFLIDTGPGSWENVQEWRLPRAHLTGILLTHFHSDHIGELGEATVQSWVGGRTHALDIYGPPGIEEVVAGFRSAYQFDAHYRNVHHGEENMPAVAATTIAHTVALPTPDGSAVVYDQDGVRITAFAVDHTPVEPAYGYRFDYNGRSVVISGDTRKSDNLAKHAAGADLLLHEALAAHILANVEPYLRDKGADRLAKLTGDVQNYHTTPVEAAQIAAASKVKMLVLTHLVPPPSNRVARRVFLQGVSDAWKGEVVLGNDGMHFVLPGGKDTIDQQKIS